MRAVSFLESVSTALAETKQPRLEQPVLFLRMHMAQYQLAAGNVEACKAAVSGAKDELDRLHDVRPRALAGMLGTCNAAHVCCWLVVIWCSSGHVCLHTVCSQAVRMGC